MIRSQYYHLHNVYLSITISSSMYENLNKIKLIQFTSDSLNLHFWCLEQVSIL